MHKGLFCALNELFLKTSAQYIISTQKYDIHLHIIKISYHALQKISISFTLT